MLAIVIMVSCAAVVCERSSRTTETRLLRCSGCVGCLTRTLPNSHGIRSARLRRALVGMSPPCVSNARECTLVATLFWFFLQDGTCEAHVDHRQNQVPMTCSQPAAPPTQLRQHLKTSSHSSQRQESVLLTTQLVFRKKIGFASLCKVNGTTVIVTSASPSTAA